MVWSPQRQGFRGPSLSFEHPHPTPCGCFFPWREGILGTQQSHRWDSADNWGFKSPVFLQKREEREVLPTRSPSKGEVQELRSVLCTSGGEEEQVRHPEGHPPQQPRAAPW